VGNPNCCPVCQKTINDRQKYCCHCGLLLLIKNLRECRCGNRLLGDDIYCDQCGAPTGVKEEDLEKFHAGV